jgi:phosphatidylglycerophosphatase A
VRPGGARSGAGRALRLILVSYGGLGLLPLAPGTWGTLGAAATAWAVLALFPQHAGHWLEICLACVVAASLLTVALTPSVERESGKDPQVVVTDEVAGYFATVALVAHPEPAHLAAGFFVFRLFDIVKPWPGRWLERLPGGWGVLLDDVMAGVYGGLLLFAVDRVTG